MPYVSLLYTFPDQRFAHELSTQLGQRGLVVWPVPEPLPLDDDEPAVFVPDLSTGLASASHVLVILSTAALQSEALAEYWEQALADEKRVIVLLREAVVVPDALKKAPHVSLDGPFLLGVEEVVRRLEKAKAPTRPLTIEHPPPVGKAGLLPIHFPSERCWRDDRLRINYTLPIIIDREEIAVRLPAFFHHIGFDLDRETAKTIRGRRQRRSYHLFDPRNAQQTFTVRPRKGRLSVYYRMTRLQVYHWFPAHYRVLDREAAALYRYLVTGSLEGTLEAVNRQARRARLVSWGAILAALILLAAVTYLFVM